MRDGSGSQLIHYRCTRPEHRSGEGVRDRLTIHERKWAFCPHDVRAGDHVWTEIPGGSDLATLIRTLNAGRTP